jgi:RNA polymerase sigma factor (sigma-70 family)
MARARAASGSPSVHVRTFGRNLGYAEAHDPSVLRHYEGLVYKTAGMLAPYVEMEREDIQQVLWIKVFRALMAWNPERSRTSRDKYVFMCVHDQGKDVLKRVRRGTLHIEDFRRDDAAEEGQRQDGFDARYLSQSHEDTYGAVEEAVLIPSTLTAQERRLVVLLYREYRQIEAARMMGIAKKDVEKLLASIRDKMADWNPGIGDDLPEPAPSPRAIAA